MNHKIYILLGAFIALTPFLGLPWAYKTPIIFVLGVLVVGSALFEEKYSRKKAHPIRRVYRKPKISPSVQTSVPVIEERSPQTMVTNLVEPHEAIKEK